MIAYPRQLPRILFVQICPKRFARFQCFKSEAFVGEVRHALCHARGDSGVSVGGVGRKSGQHNADETAIVQNVGAPFAALQWTEKDSVNRCR